ncbi:DUF2262 domain-containing protein [Treponema denticola]|uniref:DUF2262 domain-containing protein n=1 Tax=Treponema denticola TaxID=158 RepID=UPI0002B5FB13|nr:DUF2262 domain-containing protein [Treponema denticola]EMB46025.1 hypothetical protein HMPREF9730_01151 [Treponema denticola AL-2]
MELIEYMRLRNKMTQKEWEDSFEKKEKEIIVLRNEGGGGSLRNGFWDWAAYFLAYVDCETGELHKEEGRIVFPVTDKENLPYQFEDETIYRLKVRAKLPEEVPNGALPAKKHFLVVEVLEKNAACKELEEILAEYRKPIILQDDILGELIYDKQIKSFQGSIIWQDRKINIILDVDKDNKSGITKAKKALKTMLSEQTKWDEDLRSFAAKKLTKLACEWAESDDETSEITEESFAKRISLSSICMISGGSFSAYFDDDDLFFGHCITVCGSLKKGIMSADMEG